MIKKLKWNKTRLDILDQRVLPSKINYVKTVSAAQTAKAIKDMVTRGAPLIGCTAAYGYSLELNNSSPKNRTEVLRLLNKAAKALKASRPTAKALFYAVDKLHKKALDFIQDSPFNIQKLNRLRKIIAKAADDIYKEDVLANEKLSILGAKLLKGKTNIITVCNAGTLATAGIGTALGVIYKAHKQGKVNKVYACETRPYLQGARLTMFELLKNKVPSILITDNMAAHIMKTCRIGAIIAGADRIAANGDTANKIGTYMLAVLAAYHKIPFYIAAPAPTFDTTLKSGKDIPIEERSPKEVCYIKNISIAPKNTCARHPAFDVTPNKLITAIITEKGIIKPVNKKNVLRVLKS